MKHNTRDCSLCALVVEISTAFWACEPIKRSRPEACAQAKLHAEMLLAVYQITATPGHASYPTHVAADWIVNQSRLLQPKEPT
jgi:predicted metal-dependent enzyme (double-stranded beta helix superfamily)